MITEVKQSGNMPSDETAEYYTIGSYLKGFPPLGTVNADWFYDERLRVLFWSVNGINRTGQLVVPTDIYSHSEAMQCGKLNARFASHVIRQSKLWTYSASYRVMLWHCIQQATMPQTINFHMEQLKRVSAIRDEIIDAQTRLNQAWRAAACR